MDNKIKSTAPKPFVFVLMPFDEKFDDTYKFGIKGAAEDAGAYAERVDEQIFQEGILERIFNQINKADVVVADMTDRNPNVFYEVGYAHALGKIVLLLTQNADDIPFDLKHRPHIVYAGKIEKLREKLTQRLIWAISESKMDSKENILERCLVSILGIEIPEANSSNNIPVLEEEIEFIDMTNELNSIDKYYFRLPISIRNLSTEKILISYMYLLTSPTLQAKINPSILIEADTFDLPDGLSKQFKLKLPFLSLPPQAVDEFPIKVFLNKQRMKDEMFRLRIHTSNGFHDYPFRIKITN